MSGAASLLQDSLMVVLDHLTFVVVVLRVHLHLFSCHSDPSLRRLVPE